MKKICLNLMTVWERELNKIAEQITEEINHIYSGEKSITCQATLYLDGNWLAIGIDNDDGDDWEKKVIINIPCWADYTKTNKENHVEINFKFSNFQNEPYFEELEQSKTYRDEMLLNKKVLKEMIKFLTSTEKIDLEVFKSFEC